MIDEKRLLQIVVAILALIPVTTGFLGVIEGPKFLHATAPWPADLDSHFRYLSGLFLGVGIAWYSCVPAIETKTVLFRLLAAVTIIGGLARLLSLITAGMPSAGHLAGLSIELIVVPLLVAWQTKIARRPPRI